MSSERQTGFSKVAIAQGNDDNPQAIYLGNDDGFPYLIWQDYNTGIWTASTDPLTTARPKGFIDVAMCQGYGNQLYVVLIDAETRQPYLLEQSTSGAWTDAGFLVSTIQHEYGYSKVIMVQGNAGNLQVLLLGVESKTAYLIWQNNSTGVWTDGSLPTNSGYEFTTMATAQDALGNIQSIWIDTEGIPCLLWQDCEHGTWEWWNQFPCNVGSYQDVTLHLGNDENLQVVLLGTDGLPYLTWLDDNGKAWTNEGALENISGETYTQVTSCYGRYIGTQVLLVLLLGADQQIYALGQNPAGSWYSYTNPVISSSSHPGGFCAFAACIGYQQDMNLALIGADNKMPYLIYEEDQWGITNPIALMSWQWYGMLPLPQPYSVSITFTPPLSVDAILFGNGVSIPDTPGNVGLCFSGGGSRAMTAGMGQLRGLATLQQNGKSLLSQAKAISTVSGGSWLGMTYSYLNNPDVSDTDFLGAYIDPSALTTDVVQNMDDKLIGARCTSDFSMYDLAKRAIFKIAIENVEPSMIWQILIAEQILGYYDLYIAGAHGYPTTTFSFDENLVNALKERNPALSEEIFNLVADQSDSTRAHRPFPICNMSMEVAYNDYNYAAPVQANPFFTGILGTPNGTDANGFEVGGGGVTSFAFNSALQSIEGSTANLQQPRQWSLTDIVGVSSAAIAAALWQYVCGFAKDSESLRLALNEYAPQIDDKYAHLLTTNSDGEQVFKEETLVSVHGILSKMCSLNVVPVPEYYYWSPLHPNTNKNPKPTRFADAGFLENTGVGGMLAYSDIDSLIVFVNSEKQMVSTYDENNPDTGVYLNGAYIPNTSIYVEDQIPPLFGFQPYQKGKGYITYADAKNTGYQSVCQVFPSENFAPFLQGLWAASGSGTSATPATFLQTLTTVQNDWFMVSGERTVKVLWSYLNSVQNWTNLLSTDVQSLVGSDFPHFSTIWGTQLDNSEVNLMGSLTSWCIADDANSQPYLDLFTVSAPTNIVPVYQFKPREMSAFLLPPCYLTIDIKGVSYQWVMNTIPFDASNVQLEGMSPLYQHPSEHSEFQYYLYDFNAGSETIGAFSWGTGVKTNFYVYNSKDYTTAPEGTIPIYEWYSMQAEFYSTCYTTTFTAPENGWDFKGIPFYAYPPTSPI